MGGQPELAAAVRTIEAAVRAGVAAFGARAANESSASLETEVGQFEAFAIGAAAAGGEALSFSGGRGSKVVLPASVLSLFPEGAAVGVLNTAKKEEDQASSDAPEGAGQESGDKEEGKEGASGGAPDPFSRIAEDQGMRLVEDELGKFMLELSVYDKHGKRVIVEGMNPPLLFKMPGSDALGPEATCSYLDTSEYYAKWSSRGVWRATVAELLDRGLDPRGVWCFTTHLSLFALLTTALLGCTNLELFTPAGFSAIEANEGWYLSAPSQIVGAVALALLGVWLLAGLWELWCLRLGRTGAPVKRVNLCDNFLTLGPQILKHRYTVFLVYLKDMVTCLRVGRTKLRMSTLTSGVQRFLALRTGIATGCVAQHCWSGGGWLDSKASLPKTVLCRKLEFHAGMAEEVMRHDMSAGIVHSIRRFVMTFIAFHPLLDAMRVSAGSMSTAKRTLLQTCGCFGVFATNALIFNFSGAQRGWESDVSCPINPTSQLFLVVATLVSMMINVVPNAYLANIAKQVYGRPLWTVCFWVMALIYLLASVTTVVLGLANLNPVDQAKWHASLRWSLTFKFVGMPLAQAFRHFVLLEAFLYEDRQKKASEQFPVVMGLRHPCEAELCQDEQKNVDLMAGQSISAGELVKFTALLGEKLMPDFKPHSSSADVLAQAIKPLCIQPMALEELPISVDVSKAVGFKAQANFSCSVLHLGAMARRERSCLFETKSGVLSPGPDGTIRTVFETSVVGLEPGQALAFAVHEQGGGTVGIASLQAEDVLISGQWQGELPLHPVHDAKFHSGEARPVHSSEGCARQGIATMAGNLFLTVRVKLPPGYSKALAHREVHKLKDQWPRHQSEVVDGPGELQEGLTQAFAAEEHDAPERCVGFCNRVLHECLPPTRMVVQSRHAPFLQTVATVVADALDGKTSHGKVEAMLMEQDFHGVLGLLEDAGCQDLRYWIEIFAVDPQRTGENGNDLCHRELMAGLPSLIRQLRRASCKKRVADLYAGRPSKHGPLKQLLVLDRNFHFMHEKTCLAEMMLGKAMRIEQFLFLHPDEAKDHNLPDELHQLARKLGSAFNEQEAPWTEPYLEDRKAVYKTVTDLLVAAFMKDDTIKDKESFLKDLGLSDVAIATGAVLIDQGSHTARSTQGGEEELDDAGGAGGDADAAD